jgi:type I restriction enzyme S subunit
MYYFLLSQSQNIQALGIGSAIPGIDRESILSIACPIPPLKEQEQIVEILESRFTLIENLEKSINKCLNDISIFKHSVLKKAFEGKLVNQDANNESAKSLLQRIKKEKENYFEVQKVIDKLIPKKKRQMETKKTVLEILSESEEPISTQELWTNSVHDGDIESFYNEIKEIYSKLTEIKKGTQSLLYLKK